MNPTLPITEKTLSASEILPLLKHHQLLPRLQRDLIIDQAIAHITLTAEEISTASRQSDTTLRQLKLERFKREKWGHLMQSFMQPQMHSSLIDDHHPEQGILQEYFDHWVTEQLEAIA